MEAGLAFVFLSLVTLLLHGTALNGYWRWDDGAHLEFALKYSPWEYFFLPEVTRAQSGGNHITPWNTFFYDINLSLFGMDPAGHYLHLLLLIAVGASLFYVVLRRWLPWPAAIAGASALLLGKPTIHIAQGLMHGHYVTGLIFSLLAILGWVRFIDGGRTRWLWLAVFAYLLATACKEVYVPVLLLLPFLPAGTLRQRLRFFWPFVVVAVFYVAWRHIVLGQYVGGYQAAEASIDYVNVLSQFARIPYLLTSRNTGLVIGAAFLFLLLLQICRGNVQWHLFICLFAIVLLPLVPLAVSVGIPRPDRWLFVVWVAISCCIASVWQKENRSFFVLLSGLILIFGLFVLHVKEEKRLKPHFVYWDTLYKFVLSADHERQGLFVQDDADQYMSLVLGGAFNAYNVYNGRGNKHFVFLGDNSSIFSLIIDNYLFNRDYFKFHNGKMVKIDELDFNNLVSKWIAGSVTSGRRMQVRLSYANGEISWDIGPYPGNYQFYTGIGNASKPRIGSFSVQRDRNVEMIVCYKNEEEGWTACSPKLNFFTKEGNSLVWSSPGYSSAN